MFNYTMSDNFKVIQKQHGYSNKNFHTGTIEIDTASLNYIYDCGLYREDFLKYLNETKKQIDIVFVSHFHKDHICSIIDFLSREEFENTKFVIPYSEKRDKFLYGVISASDDKNSNLNANNNFIDKYTKFLDDERILWANSRINHYNNYNLLDYINDNNNYFNFDLSNNNIFDNETSQYKHLYTFEHKQRMLNWIFLTHCNCCTDEIKKVWDKIYKEAPELEEFINNKQYNLNSEDFKTFFEIFTRCNTNNRLKGIVGDNTFENLISLSLYSGPLVQEWNYKYKFEHNLHKFFKLKFLPYLIFYNDSVGWLHTGDANLLDENLLRDFISRYDCIKNMVGILSLPHHGSSNNFDFNLLNNFTSEYAIITDSSKVKKESLVEIKEKASQNGIKIIEVNNLNNFVIETISNNLNFIGKVTTKHNI